MQRLSARGLHRNLAVVAGRALLGMRLWKPVTPGTILSGCTEVIDVQLRPSGRAIVTVRSTLTAADAGTPVLEQTGELVMRQRPAW
jgi:acyl dehydratase